MKIRSDLARFGRGFVYAWNGIRAALWEERNFRFHLCASFYAYAAAYLAGLDATGVALLSVCIFAVIAMELMNSAVERAVDKPDTTHWWSAGAAKDMAAGAVMLTAIGAVCVGVCLLHTGSHSALGGKKGKGKRRMPNDPGKVKTSSVFVALVGRPNVGKSSLTNRLVGEKVAIVTQKPQTTRSRITGILTRGPVQYVLMDTPGIHVPRNKLDARMTQTAAASIKDVDVTVMLFEPSGPFTESELKMIEALRQGGPALAVINKVDLLRDFSALEARERELEALGVFEAVLTVSAQDGTGCEALLEKLRGYAEPGPHYFDDDAFTDMPEKELVAELIREKLLLFMREEIPHGVAVTVESFKERPDRDLVDIAAVICCERQNHKGMIIGKGGQMLKKIATAARLDCEDLLGVHINLSVFVKVVPDWRNREKQIDELGFAKP